MHENEGENGRLRRVFSKEIYVGKNDAVWLLFSVCPVYCLGQIPSCEMLMIGPQFSNESMIMVFSSSDIAGSSALRLQTALPRTHVYEYCSSSHGLIT